ncbi:Tctex-1 family protein [Toxoplasma gondii CAST]|uniref:Tctex-1 family protein n=1 Tax=Toxoplasma gondii CAST TaxID=943122 RepID=A0A425I3P9_TOXGO|nr:Tctex-1 family protein [Toxoplasma gondii CAST]
MSSSAHHGVGGFSPPSGLGGSGSNAVTVYECTYRLGPSEEEKFFPSRVESMLETVMSEFFKDKVFDAQQAPIWAQQASGRVMEEMHAMRQQMPRFKIVVQVVIAENAGQGIRVSSKSLWDVNLDNWGSYTHIQSDMYAVALVFGCYQE